MEKQAVNRMYLQNVNCEDRMFLFVIFTMPHLALCCHTNLPCFAYTAGKIGWMSHSSSTLELLVGTPILTSKVLEKKLIYHYSLDQWIQTVGWEDCQKHLAKCCCWWDQGKTAAGFCREKVRWMTREGGQGISMSWFTRHSRQCPFFTGIMHVWIRTVAYS